MNSKTMTVKAKTKAPRAPGTFDELRQEIARLHADFSDRLRVIAEFALEHPTDMALGTVAEVAQRAKVQPSAIVRFANAVGYSGFTEMQQVFRTRLVDSVVPSYKDRITRMRRDGRFDGANNQRSVLSRFRVRKHCVAGEPAGPRR